VASRLPRRKFGVFTILSICVFVASVVGFGLSFFYERQIERQVAALDDLVRRSEDAFDRSLLEEIARVDKKIMAAREVLAGHISLRSLFELIDRNTLHTIRFTAFGFEKHPENGYILSMQGVGRDYASIALQSEAFVQTRRLKNVVFSNLRLTNEGTITFALSATIESDLLAYDLTI